MKLLRLLTLTCLTATFSLTAVADWILLEDFETSRGVQDFNLRYKFEDQGDIFIEQFDPQDEDNWIYFADPGPSRAVGGNNQIWNSMSLPEPVPADGKATLKYRMYFFESGPFNVNIGLSATPVVLDETRTKEQGQLIEPFDYAGFESQVGWTDKGIITVRNGNSFSDTQVPIPVGEWTTIYYLIDNETDRTQLYYQGEGMEEPEVVELVDGSTDFLFRNGTDDPLVTLTVVSAGSNSGPVSVFLLDDIYYDPTGFNLGGAELPEGPPVWAGNILNEDGSFDTGDWLGWVNAANDPWVYVYDLDTYLYIPGDWVTEEGAWTYFPYHSNPPAEWNANPGGFVYTGDFMRWIYDTGDDWVYSGNLRRWLYMPQVAADDAGIWGYLGHQPPPLVDGDYEIPAMTQAPLIDGILSDGEWTEANMYDHSYESLILTDIGTSWLDVDAGEPDPDAPRASADVYMGATKQGLYMAFDVTDDQLTIVNQFAAAGNDSDGVQIGINLDPDPANRDHTVLFDITPASLVNGEPSGPPSVFARWAADGYDVTWGVDVASLIHDDGYSMEVMIPWAFLESLGVDNPLELGSNFRFTVTLRDMDAGTDGNTHELLWDSGSGVKGVGNTAMYPVAAIADELMKTAITHSVPKVSTAPTIDGTFDPAEWTMAYYTEASFENWVNRSTGASREGVADAVRSEGGIYLLATDEALYMAAEIVAPTLSITNAFGTASNNESGVQMALSLDPDPAAARDDASVLWDFTAATVEGGDLTGPANILGRWGISPGYDAAWGVEAAGSFTDDGYIIEVKMPWDVMRDSVNVPVANALEKGDEFKLSFIIVNVLEDGTVNELLVDFSDGSGGFSIGDPSTWNRAVIRD